MISTYRYFVGDFTTKYVVGLFNVPGTKLKGIAHPAPRFVALQRSLGHLWWQRTEISLVNLVIIVTSPGSCMVYLPLVFYDSFLCWQKALEGEVWAMKYCGFFRMETSCRPSYNQVVCHPLILRHIHDAWSTYPPPKVTARNRALLRAY